jgi:hypothetical protein
MLRNPVHQYFPRPLLSHSSLVTTQLPSPPTPPPLVFFVSRSDLLALTSLLDRPFLPLHVWMLTCVACPPFLPSLEVHPHTPPRPRHADGSTSAYVRRNGHVPSCLWATTRRHQDAQAAPEEIVLCDYPPRVCGPVL